MKINYQQFSIEQLHQLLVKGDITPETLIDSALKRLKKFSN